MKTNSLNQRVLPVTWIAGLICAGVLTAAPKPAPKPAATPAAPATPAASAQSTYASPEEAMKDLAGALKADDKDKLSAIFGPELKSVLSVDPVERKEEAAAFTKAFDEAAKLQKVSDDKYVIEIGPKAWPVPFPLVRGKDGKWSFDTAAGREEILNRRIGENELGAITMLLNYVDAQREFVSGDWEGDGILCYAQNIVSTPGTKDGLYWQTGADGVASPLQEVVAEAKSRGYATGQGGSPESQSYDGYVYRILTKQGPDAPLGRYNYVINGKMIAGFAGIAYPAKYGNSGVMTFIVNQQGIVYQQDLGPNTTELAKAITEYNPGKGWTPAQVEPSAEESNVGKN